MSSRVEPNVEPKCRTEVEVEPKLSMVNSCWSGIDGDATNDIAQGALTVSDE